MKAFHLDTIDSTNEAAKRMLRAGEIAGDAYISAREQTAGRGSRGRRWVSLRDAGIYLSVVHLPQPALAAGSVDLTLITLATGVACVDFLAGLGAEARLKPVNDLIVDGRKLGGILTEALIERGTVEAVIVGVGINIRHGERVLADGGTPPICLAQAIGRDVVAGDLVNGVPHLAGQVQGAVKSALAGHSARIRQDWLAWAVPGAILPKPPGVQ